MSLLSGIGKALGGGITGLIGGGLPGAIAGFAGGILGRTGGTTMPVPTMSGGGLFSPGPYTGGIPTPGQVTQGGFFGGGAATSCPKGYHLNKHPLAASKKHGAVPAHSMCVRNRSMNPMNYRALTRSLRRVKRAGKIVRKLHHFHQPAQRRLPRATAISENLRITSGR